MKGTLGGTCTAYTTPELAGKAALRLATAYQESRALHVALRLDIPDLLTGGPKSVEDLAHDAEANAASLRRLIRALAAYEVFSKATDRRFTLGPLGAELRTGAPGSVRDFSSHWT